MKITPSLFAFLALVSLSNGATEECPHSAHAGHDHSVATPIGVMGGHVHKAGEWMFSYRHMFMNMEGMYQGDQQRSTSEVLNDFMMTPIDMQMQMHMFGAMYAPSDSITLVAMTNYISNEMIMENRMGVRSTMESEGLGDTSVGALFSLRQIGSESVHAGLSIVLPTAGTNEKNSTGGTLPYGMQLGTGSWGIKPSLTYLNSAGDLSWGAQATAQFQLNDNANGYRVGNSISTTAWTGYKVTENLSLLARVEAKSKGKIQGEHENLTVSMMSPLLNPENTGGSTIEAFIGAAYKSHGVTISAEAGQTLWQDLNGTQLGYDWSMTFGASVAF